MAFVPAAENKLSPDSQDYADVSLQRPILVDLYEFTRGELSDYWSEFNPDVELRSSTVTWTTVPALDKSPDWPAFLTWHEARQVAEWRGMRIPTAQEWLHVAMGRSGLKYPWGSDQESRANTYELGLHLPLPVGSFEGGRSRPFGCYDLLGNVWEWVDGAVPGYSDDRIDIESTNGLQSLRWGHSESAGDRVGRRVSALGGAYDTTRKPIYDSQPRHGFLSFFYHARRLDPNSLSPSIGVRMCADAGDYLWQKAPAWGASGRARARVVAIAQRWSEDVLARAGLIELLEELLERENPPAALNWLKEGARSEGGAGDGS